MVSVPADFAPTSDTVRMADSSVSAAAYPSNEAQEIHNEANTIRPEHADWRIPVDCLLPKFASRRRTRSTDDEGAEEGFEPHPSAQELLFKPSVL